MCVCSGLKVEIQTEQPDLSNLPRGKFWGCSTERPILMLTAFGRDVEVAVRPAPRSRKQGGIRSKSVAARMECTVGAVFLITLIVLTVMVAGHDGQGV